MTVLHWDESPLGKNHDRKTFDCGDGDPDIYLQRHARQNHESGGAKCFVATPRETPARILGFYTLSPASIEFERVPAIATRGLGRYDVPVYRLGRLAVDRSVQGRGLGGRLLLRAAERCMLVAQQAGGVALLIDAQNEAVAEWYRTYDAVQLNDAPLSLVLPFMVAAKALEQNNLTLPRRRFRSAGIESGEVVSDAHEGIKAAVSKVFRAAAKRFAATAKTQWRKVVDQLRPKVPKLAGLMDEAEPDVLATMTFPAKPGIAVAGRKLHQALEHDLAAGFCLCKAG